ncbi:hypothetical protein EPUL_003527 [Erysiphe pulchra]|uniref:Helitron helicase-like domain-containing protein n=1 Tax=Erysiphe pulchra TaxID=225359 RepID=A0A2S4PVK3_9PEZI|nr:hypothetical protein EPUL_003527 [Erysiphe pulchra]
MDTLSNRTDQIGDPVILAASYDGRDRFIARCFQSAVAIARALKNPLVFTTFSANPSWSEVIAKLEHNQTPDSWPDLIAEVFKLKLDQMLHDFKESYVREVSNGSVYTIEY